ncbi:MAG: GAF domain-containing protein [Deltaproteobacteria bacterium]|nr:GAF domain-containing protein [Deltaproteobacteria bacterium]
MLPPETDTSSNTLKTLNVAIVGGGVRCKALLEMAFRHKLKRFRMNVLGVADPNTRAPGLVFARRHSIFTTKDYHDFYELKSLDLIIEVTGKKGVRDGIVHSKPRHIRIMDHDAANLFWDFLQLEDEQAIYERDTIEKVRKEFSQHTRELSVLNSIIHTVNQSLDVNGIGRETLKQVRCWLDMDMAWIHIRDPKRNKWESFGDQDATGGVPEGFFAEIQPEYFLPRGVDKKGPVVMNRTSRLPISLERHGMQSVVNLPLYSGEELVGVVCLASRRPRDFLDREIQVLQSISEEIAIGVAKATLFDTVCQDKREWESTFDAITAHIFIVDSRFRILKANKAFLADYGLDNAEQRKCYEVVCQGKEPCQECAVQEVFRLKATVALEREHPVLGGFFRYNYFPAFTPEGEVSSVTIYEEDITDIKRAEDKIIDFQKRLIKSESIAAMGRLAASIAHEIRNPLGALSNSISLLRKSITLAGPLQELMEIMAEEVGRLNNIVHDFLTYSRPKKLQYAKIDINKLLSETVTLLTKDKELMGECQIQCLLEDAPPVKVDGRQIRTAVQNLLINALQASRGKGLITVTTEKAVQNHQRLFKIGIHDTGKGICQDNSKKIFEPFFSTRAKGLGLGLAIARTIVEGHGGDIEVRSEEGVGTSVFVELPLER